MYREVLRQEIPGPANLFTEQLVWRMVYITYGGSLVLRNCIRTVAIPVTLSVKIVPTKSVILEGYRPYKGALRGVSTLVQTVHFGPQSCAVIAGQDRYSQGRPC